MEQFVKIMNVLITLAFVLATCFVSIRGVSSQQVRSIDPSIQKRIDDFITKAYFPVAKISKLGLSIVRNNGEILYSTGYGMADEKKGIPNGNQTQFLIGSVTKSFTTTLTVKVLHELFPKMGEAVLDTPIVKLMPSSINFTLIDRFRSEHFTFRDLLAHRMCIFRDDLQLLAEPFSETAEIFYRERYAADVCGMRNEFQYNNEMFVVAAELISILTKKTYTELMKNLLEEIGMHNTSILSKSDDFSKMPFRAQPYYVLNGSSHPINTDLIKRAVLYNPAGGLYIPPDDMVKYMKFRLNKGNVDGKQIVPKDVMEWMTKTSNHLPVTGFRTTKDAPIIVSAFGYGLGMILASFNGWEYNFHNGYFPPYSTQLSLFPALNLGIYTSSNEGPVMLDQIIVHAFIFQLLQGNKNASKDIRKFWKEKEQQHGDKKRKELKALEKFLEENENHGKSLLENKPRQIIGKYGSGGSGDAEILEKYNPKTNTTSLYVKYGKWYHGWLDSIGGSTYRVYWDTDVIQDHYAEGDAKGYGYAKVENKTLQFFIPVGPSVFTMGTFKQGVSLDNLPKIPWDPNSC